MGRKLVEWITERKRRAIVVVLVVLALALFVLWLTNMMNLVWTVFVPALFLAIMGYIFYCLLDWLCDGIGKSALALLFVAPVFSIMLAALLDSIIAPILYPVPDASYILFQLVTLPLLTLFLMCIAYIYVAKEMTQREARVLFLSVTALCTVLVTMGSLAAQLIPIRFILDLMKMWFGAWQSFPDLVAQFKQFYSLDDLRGILSSAVWLFIFPCWLPSLIGSIAVESRKEKQPCSLN